MLAYRNVMQSLISVNTSDWAQRQKGRKNFTFDDLDSFARNTDMRHDADSFSGGYYLASCQYHMLFHNSIYQILKAGTDASNDELRQKLVSARDRTIDRLGAMRGELSDAASSLAETVSASVDKELESLSMRTNPAGGGGGGAGGGAGAPTANPGNAGGAAAPTKPSGAPHLSPEEQAIYRTVAKRLQKYKSTPEPEVVVQLPEGFQREIIFPDPKKGQPAGERASLTLPETPALPDGIAPATPSYKPYVAQFATTDPSQPPGEDNPPAQSSLRRAWDATKEFASKLRDTVKERVSRAFQSLLGQRDLGEDALNATLDAAVRSGRLKETRSDLKDSLWGSVQDRMSDEDYFNGGVGLNFAVRMSPGFGSGFHKGLYDFNKDNLNRIDRMMGSFFGSSEEKD